MIELQHVSKTFETVSGSVEAVRDVNLTIQDGDIFGVIGLSGAGKKHPRALYQFFGAADGRKGFVFRRKPRLSFQKAVA